jgi:branched-chain amino acid transport system permease protein
MDWANIILQGVLLGGVYALFATGLAVVFGVMRIVNLAHGDFGILAAYVALVFADRWGINPLFLTVVSCVILFGVGYALQTGLLNRAMVGGDEMRPLLITFGLAVIIQNLLLEVFSADSQGLDPGKLRTESITITGKLAIGWFPLISFLLGVAVIVAMQLFLSRTKLGRAFRATSDDQEAARLMGIDNRRVYALAMGISLAIVALAGVFMGIRTTFAPAFGGARLIFGFEAVIIGGMGSLWGTLLGGIVLGVAQAIGAQIEPGWGVLFGNIVFLTILAIKPSGFFAKTVTS